MSRRSDIGEAVRTERERLLADLRDLSEEKWEAQSLCADWKVRDVVGHLIRIGEYYKRQYPFEWDLVRYGFRLNRALSSVARRIGSRPIPELLERLERSRYEETLVFRLHYQPLFALSEWVVHGQDIRRPLGLKASFDPKHLVEIGALSMKWYTWGTRREPLRNRLVATDADWSVGGGPVLKGPLEAVVMVLFGRDSALSDLEAQT